jgi:two-component system OmpR family response regulator
MRILLVEDDENVAQVVMKGMSEASHHVTHASDGGDGFSRALTEPYDVMIFDRMLPGGVDGADLLQNLREQQVSTPVLFLSGLGELHDWVKGLDAGGDDYLVKPFAIADLLSHVEALHRRHLDEQKASPKA